LGAVVEGGAPAAGGAMLGRPVAGVFSADGGLFAGGSSENGLFWFAAVGAFGVSSAESAVSDHGRITSPAVATPTRAGHDRR
jgi:hypothetical protein